MEQGENNRDYCLRRAAEERAAAEHAADERAAHAHRDLARHFDELSKQANGQQAADEPLRAGILSPEFRIIP